MPRIVSDIEFSLIWLNAKSYSDISRQLDYNYSGGNNKLFINRAARLGLNLTINFMKKPSTRWTKENAFVENCDCSNDSLKRLIKKHDLKQWKCEGLGNGCITNTLPDWNGGPLKLELDHINGNRKDNRLENIRLLCGCCHKQTKTHGGGNKAHRKRY